MKVLTTAGLTKLIQLIKSAFISVNDVEQTSEVTLATVATSGSYNDLSNKPTIPAAQVNSDWNASSGVAEILNKPTIPVVYNSTITFTQGGTTKGTITLNQSNNATIALDAGGGSAPTNMVTTNTNQDITAQKTFVGEKKIKFKQSSSADKLGFTLYTSGNAELGALEWRPNTINGNALLALNCPQSGTNYVGFRYWGNINIVAPRPTTNGSYFITIGVTDGTNTVYTQTDTGVINISTLLSGKQDTLVSGTNIKTINNISLLGSGNIDIHGGGGSYTAGTGIDITNNVISADIATSVSSASTNSQSVSAKLFYDTCGDIETLINAL